MSPRFAARLLLPAVLGCATPGPGGGVAQPPPPQEEEVWADAETLPVLSRAVLIVGETVITSRDLERMRDTLQKKNRLLPKERRTGRTDWAKEAENALIERAIVTNEAEKESILVSDTMLENEIQKRREAMGIEDAARHRALMEKETGLDFETWREEIRASLTRSLVVQLKVPVAQPTETEISGFYEKNKKRFGLEARYREIVLSPKDGSLEEEKRISALAAKLRARAAKSPKSFAKIAENEPSNTSPLRWLGGLRDYVPLQEVAVRDRRLAGMLMGLKPGTVSPVFRDASGAYVFVLLERRRSVPYESLRGLIQRHLYVENEEKAFGQWLENRKKNVSIRRVDA